ncbi:MAG: hypothetical protein EOP62_10905 [Sphingomonadales bacterium]|nr:MAG: hypothetical protein EOP62_10905 [Sphingomonadales bacterium]
MSGILALLRATRPTKYEGVEGLVAVLLADALGLEARIEASGSQRGRDIGLFDRASGAARHIDIEVKRYQGDRPPDKRELFGEIAETWLARPATELWVVVSTAAIPAAAVEELNRLAFHHGIDVLVLDCAPEGGSLLEVLIAEREAVTLDWVARTQPAELDAWRTAIAATRIGPAFAVQAQEIGERLVSRYAGKAAREHSHRWLAGHVASRRERFRELNQSLGRVGRAPAIPRVRIEAAWRDWQAGRGTETQMLVLLGGEGDGKTWSAIDALLADSERTVLVTTSNLFDDGGAESLIAHALARQCGGDADRWRSRLDGKGSWPGDFRITLLVDGLNETPHRRTDLLLTELMTGPWNGVLDVIVTCRTPFWLQRIEPYLRPHEKRLTLIEVGPFDYYDEWPRARAALGNIGALPDGVTEALRNPRLWSFAYDLKDEIGGMAEVTLERLLVEHWRLRIRERGELRVDPEAFNYLIARSVAPLLGQGDAKPGILRLGDVEAMLRQMAGGNVDLTADLADLRDGVFFEPAGGGGMTLRNGRVPAALGVLLAERLAEAAGEDDPEDAVHRAAAAFLYDLPAADTVELVVRTAVFALLAMPGGSPRAVPTLLRHWVSLQNFERDFYRALAIVAAAAPEAMLRAIEDEASEDQFAGDASSELASALRGRRDQPQVACALHAAVTRWLRSYSVEHFPRMGELEGQLIASRVAWIESLDDTAAHFLAEMPLDQWAQPLGYWARRRAARLRFYGSSYDYMTFLPWLGASGDHDGQRLADFSVAAGCAIDPPLTDAEREALAEFLDGRHLLETAVVQELLDQPWDETHARVHALEEHRAALMRGKSPVPFEDLYGDGSANAAEHWLQLEAWLLRHDPVLLEHLVHSLFRESGKMGKRRMTPGHLLFIREHALLLGEPVVAYVARLGAAANKRISCDAMPAVFAVSDPVWHRERLLSVIERWQHRLADLTGYAPHRDEFATRALRLSASRGLKAPALVLLADLARLGTGPLSEQDTELLVQFSANEDDKISGPAIEIIDRSEDLSLARRFAASGRTVETVHRRRVASALSATILRGSAQPDYAALRLRIVAGSFPDAAEADGSVAAARQLKADFNAILARTASENWPVGACADDLDALATCGNLGLRRVLRSETGLDGLNLSLDEAERFLDVIGKDDSGYLEALLDKPDAVSDGALVAAEEKAWLVSALARRAPVEDAIAWMLRLHAHYRLRIDHKGLLVTSAVRFAFTDPRPEIDALRNRLAESAWSDGAMLDLVCMAQLEGQEAWLDAWIEREDKAASRAQRMRALLLRGWRASPEDREALEVHPDELGYDRFARAIALARAARLERVRQAMHAYAAASSVGSAWLAHRQLLHAIDRRIHVEHQLQGWPEALPRARRVMHEMATGDFERMIRRNEGDLDRLFAGAVSPPSMPPWGHIEIYSPQDDWG